MRALKHFFETISKFINIFATWYAFISILILLGLIIAQVILRYFLHMPLFGIEEMEIYPILWIYAFGGVIASFDKRHIECGVAGVIVKNETVIKYIERVKCFATLLLAIGAVYWMYPHFTYIFKVTKTTTTMGLPTRFCDGSIMVGLVLMLVIAIRDLIQSFIPEDEGGILK